MKILRETVPAYKDHYGRERVRITSSFKHLRLGKGSLYACLESFEQKTIDVIANGKAIFIGEKSKIDKTTIIYSGVVIRQGTSIVKSTLYKGANIGIDCIINNSVFEYGVHVQDVCNLDGAKILSNVEVGRGTKILNSSIGRNSRIGLDCVITDSVLYCDSFIGHNVTIDNVDANGTIDVGSWSRLSNLFSIRNISIPESTTIDKVSWFMSFGSVGSRKDQLFVINDDDEVDGLRWSTGCQSNITTTTFLERLEGEHDKKSLAYREYKAIIAFVRNHPEFKLRMKARPTL